MRTATISRLAYSLGAATLATLVACNSDNPTAPRVITPTVTAPVALAGGSITVTYCASQVPIWAASQDGTGPWKRVMPTSTNTFVFNFTTGKGGVATVATSGAGFRFDVVFATLADFGGQTKSTNLGCPGTKVVKGSVAHVAPGQLSNVELGTSSAFVIGGGPTTFTLNNVQAGPRDLIATRGSTSLAVNSIIIRRSLNPTTGSTLPVLDFGASTAFAPASAHATVTGVPTGAKAALAVLFFSPRGTGAALFGASNFTGGSQPYVAIPPAKLLTGEFQLLSATTAPTASSSRNTGIWIKTVTNRALAFGPALSPATVSTAGSTPYYRPRIRVLSQTQYNKGVSVSFNQASANRVASIFATAAYFGAAPATWDVSLPDLHTVTGFLTAWGPKTSQVTKWTLAGFGGTLPFFTANPADGSTFLSAFNSGSLTSH
ncbi:MAG TPA: hypothetical protein VJO52_13025 [Gemmatimonadaceae bacterium]|nr:hypothetical protein [Gemmatimonadaceae bacterium]